MGDHYSSPVFLVTSLYSSLPHQLITPHLNFSSGFTTLNFVTLTPSGSLFSSAVAHYVSYGTVFRVSMLGSNFLLVFMEIHQYVGCVGSFVHIIFLFFCILSDTNTMETQDFALH